jgi:hypothetical protein
VSMPTDIATSKGAQVFAAAQQGDVEAQRIVKAAVECVADQVQRAIAIHAATTGVRVNKQAGIDTTPNTTLGPHGMSAAELAGLVATAQQLTKPLRTTLQSADSTLDPQSLDRIRERAKIHIDPATMQVIRPISPTTHTSGDPDNRPGLSDRTGSPA